MESEDARLAGLSGAPVGDLAHGKRNQKFKPPPTPMELEESLGKIVAPPNVAMYDKMVNAANQMMKGASDPVVNGLIRKQMALQQEAFERTIYNTEVSERQRDKTLTARLDFKYFTDQVHDALTKLASKSFAKNVMDASTPDPNQEFADDFILWLQGKSPHNKQKLDAPVIMEQPTDTSIPLLNEDGDETGFYYDLLSLNRGTPWGNFPLTHLPDVQEYLESFLNQRSAVKTYFAKILLNRPQNLPEAYFFYKYYVRGAAIDNNFLHYLKEWGYIDDPPNDPKQGPYVLPVQVGNEQLTPAERQTGPYRPHDLTGPVPPPFGRGAQGPIQPPYMYSNFDYRAVYLQNLADVYMKDYKLTEEELAESLNRQDTWVQPSPQHALLAEALRINEEMYHYMDWEAEMLDAVMEEPTLEEDIMNDEELKDEDAEDVAEEETTGRKRKKKQDAINALEKKKNAKQTKLLADKYGAEIHKLIKEFARANAHVEQSNKNVKDYMDTLQTNLDAQLQDLHDAVQSLTSDGKRYSWYDSDTMDTDSAAKQDLKDTADNMHYKALYTVTENVAEGLAYHVKAQMSAIADTMETLLMSMSPPGLKDFIDSIDLKEVQSTTNEMGVKLASDLKSTLNELKGQLKANRKLAVDQAKLMSNMMSRNEAKIKQAFDTLRKVADTFSNESKSEKDAMPTTLEASKNIPEARNAVRNHDRQTAKANNRARLATQASAAQKKIVNEIMEADAQAQKMLNQTGAVSKLKEESKSKLSGKRPASDSPSTPALKMIVPFTATTSSEQQSEHADIISNAIKLLKDNVSFAALKDYDPGFSLGTRQDVNTTLLEQARRFATAKDATFMDKLIYRIAAKYDKAENAPLSTVNALTNIVNHPQYGIQAAPRMALENQMHDLIVQGLSSNTPYANAETLALDLVDTAVDYHNRSFDIIRAYVVNATSQTRDNPNNVKTEFANFALSLSDAVLTELKKKGPGLSVENYTEVLMSMLTKSPNYYKLVEAHALRTVANNYKGNFNVAFNAEYQRVKMWDKDEKTSAIPSLDKFILAHNPQPDITADTASLQAQAVESIITARLQSLGPSLNDLDRKTLKKMLSIESKLQYMIGEASMAALFLADNNNMPAMDTWSPGHIKHMLQAVQTAFHYSMIRSKNAPAVAPEMKVLFGSYLRDSTKKKRSIIEPYDADEDAKAMRKFTSATAETVQGLTATRDSFIQNVDEENLSGIAENAKALASEAKSDFVPKKRPKKRTKSDT